MACQEQKSKDDGNMQRTRDIKNWVRTLLPRGEEATVLATEMHCTLPDGPPTETMIALMQPGPPIQQDTIHKPLRDITLDDVIQLITQPATFTRVASTIQDQGKAR